MKYYIQEYTTKQWAYAKDTYSGPRQDSNKVLWNLHEEKALPIGDK